MGIGDIGLFRVMRSYRPVHPLFVPPDFVHTVIMATAVRNGGFVELAVVEHGGCRTLSTGRSPVNANAGDIHVWACFGCFSNPFDAIGEAGIDKVFVCEMGKITMAIVGSKGINLHYNEPFFCKVSLAAMPWMKFFRDKRTVWTCVDVFNDGVLFLGIEVGRFDNDAVDIKSVVSILADKPFWKVSPGLNELASIRPEDFTDFFAVATAV